MKALLIDIDDTLLDFNLCAEWSMYQTAKEMNLSLPKDTFEHFKQINSSLWKQMERKEITSDGIYIVRWNKVSQTVGIPFDGNEFENYFLDYLSKSTIQVDGALEILEYLSSKYMIYAASNGPYEQQVQRMKLADMDRYLSGYFISEKIGFAKPSKEFFEACYKRIGVSDLNEIMMIGDSLSADIKGALDYGIKTCWFDKYLKESENSADYIIHHLSELKDIL